MTNKAVALGALALVLAAGVVVYGHQRSTSKADTLATIASPRSIEDYKVADRELQRATAKSSRRAPKEVPVGTVLAGDTRIAALSADERAWLNRHHFLSEDELNASKTIPDEALRSARTDARAQTLWGMRLLDRGEIIPAAAVLTNAASHGSVFGYEEAAVALLKQQMRGNNGKADENAANAFRARMEVAKIMGDHRADALFAQYFPNYDIQANARTVQLQTTEFLRQLGANAQLQGTAAAGPDPRPNADLWANLQQLQEAGGSTDLVSVYGP